MGPLGSHKTAIFKIQIRLEMQRTQPANVFTKLFRQSYSDGALVNRAVLNGDLLKEALLTGALLDEQKGPNTKALEQNSRDVP